VIIPEKKNPVKPLHTAEYGFARFGTLITPCGNTMSPRMIIDVEQRCLPYIFQHPIIHALIPGKKKIVVTRNMKFNRIPLTKDSTYHGT
jgi:hypothetical protein